MTRIYTGIAALQLGVGALLSYCIGAEALEAQQ